MPMSLGQVQTSLALWQTAYDAVSKGQTFSMNGRSLTRSDADMCWLQITRLSRMENRLLSAGAGANNTRHSLAKFVS